MSSSNNDTETEPSQSFSKIINDWCSKLPSYGFRRISQARTLSERLFWSYVVWIFIICAIGLITNVISQFVLHRTVVNLSVRHEKTAEDFPAITFCNINPLRDDGFLVDIRKSRFPTQTGSSVLNESEYGQAFTDYIERIFADKAEGKTHPFVEWGYKLNDLLIECIFNGRYCHRNLSQIFHPNYGNCFTFDPFCHTGNLFMAETRPDWIFDDLVGNNFKLYLELFLRQQEYNFYLDDRAAFRIFFHRKHEVPMLSQGSVFLPPNRYTKLSFSQRIFSYHRNCRKTLTKNMKKVFPENQVRYTQALCNKLCEQRFIEEKCHCIEPTLFVFYQFYGSQYKQKNNHTRICSIDEKCLQDRQHFNAKQICTECLPECEIIQYIVQSSYAAYPNGPALDGIWRRVEAHFSMDKNISQYLNGTGQTQSNRRLVLEGNILAVEISASSHVTEILIESPMYTWVDVISSIGGQTSQQMFRNDLINVRMTTADPKETDRRNVEPLHFGSESVC